MKKIILILLLAWIPFTLQAAKAQAPTHPMSVPDMIQYYANINHVNPNDMTAVMNCESGGSMNPPGSNDNGHAHGAFQYHVGTWQQFEKEMGTTYDMSSIQDQIIITAWAFAHGKKNQWTCSYITGILKNRSTNL